MRVRLVELFLWQAEQGSRRTRRYPRDDPRAEVGEDVRVGFCVGVVECQLYRTRHLALCISRRAGPTALTDILHLIWSQMTEMRRRRSGKPPRFFQKAKKP